MIRTGFVYQGPTDVWTVSEILVIENPLEDCYITQIRLTPDKQHTAPNGATMPLGGFLKAIKKGTLILTHVPPQEIQPHQAAAASPPVQRS